MKVLEALSISKIFVNLKAVNDLSIEVGQGEIYGFLGLNGAGKTTSIRMLLGMIAPSTGTVRFFGAKVKSGDTLLNKVGYLVETPASYPELTVVENLEIYYRYRKMVNPESIESIIHKLQLVDYRNVKSKHLSLGNKQRLGLAKAMFHNPELLILDEPTNGLDPAGIVEFRNLLKDLSSKGVTILVSSHLLDEISKVATRIGIIHQGTLVRELNSRQLDEELVKTVVIRVREVERGIALMTSLGYNVSSYLGSDLFTLKSRDAIDQIEKIAKQIVEAEVGLKEIYVEQEDLESYFLRQVEQREHNA
jgi:ABC-2 type transport system ATP-binding protein